MARIRIAAVAAAAAGCLIAVMFLASRPARASVQETVRLADGATVSLSTPVFIVKGRRYAITWPGGGPPQTFAVKELRKDGWILVEVSEENVDPNMVPYGTLPVRWLNVGLATSIQEMRPLLQ